MPIPSANQPELAGDGVAQHHRAMVIAGGEDRAAGERTDEKVG